MGICKAGISSHTKKDMTERELTENKALSDTHATSHYLIFTDRKHNTTPLTLADNFETMTDSHTDNESSVEIDREDSHQLYQHENTYYIDTSPTRDNLENEDI